MLLPRRPGLAQDARHEGILARARTCRLRLVIWSDHARWFRRRSVRWIGRAARWSERRDPDQARRRHRQREPHLRQLLRLVPRRRGHDHVSRRRTDDDHAVPHAPDRTSRDLCHEHSVRARRLERRQDGRLGRVAASSERRQPRVRAVPGSRHPELLAVRAALHARRSLLRERCSARASPATSFVLAAQAGWALGNPTPRSLHPYWGCDQDAATTHRRSRTRRRCTDEAGVPVLRHPDACPTSCRRASTGSSTARTSTCCPRSGRCSTRSTRSATDRAGRTSSTSTSSTTDIDERARCPTVVVAREPGPRRRAPEHRRRLRRRELDRRPHQQADEQSDYWKDTAILFTMDDFGGWYDHVPPPRQYGCDPRTRRTASASACRSSSSRRTRSPASSSRRSPSRRASRVHREGLRRARRRCTTSIRPRRTRQANDLLGRVRLHADAARPARADRRAPAR